MSPDRLENPCSRLAGQTKTADRFSLRGMGQTSQRARYTARRTMVRASASVVAVRQVMR
jgi:hypothetical protein